MIVRVFFDFYGFCINNETRMSILGMITNKIHKNNVKTQRKHLRFKELTLSLRTTNYRQSY